jgi:hypothetical protein
VSYMCLRNNIVHPHLFVLQPARPFGIPDMTCTGHHAWTRRAPFLDPPGTTPGLAGHYTWTLRASPGAGHHVWTRRAPFLDPPGTLPGPAGHHAWTRRALYLDPPGASAGPCTLYFRGKRGVFITEKLSGKKMICTIRLYA